VNEVEAVKTKDEIKEVERYLRKRGGDLYGDLWRIGVNLALRISDLLAIRYDAIDFDRHEYEASEQKTGKKRTVKINQVAMDIIERRHKANPNDVYLFQVHSNRTASDVPKPVSRVSVARKFKDVGETMKMRLGTHSMRKSRGWAMYSDGVPIEMIAKVLNHSTPAVTMTYLGITKADVLQTYIDYQL